MTAFELSALRSHSYDMSNIFEKFSTQRKENGNVLLLFRVGTFRRRGEMKPQRERPKMIEQQGDQNHDSSVTRRSLTLDTHKYQAMLDDPDMTGDQKAALIEALWIFVVSFMDLGYEIKPAENCGQEETKPDLNEDESAPVLLCRQAKKSVRPAFFANSASKEVS